MPRFFHRPPLELLGGELLFFFVVAALCLIIYARTRDIYCLTKHKGIYYFRNTFLFFALAYFFRLLHVVVRLSNDLFGRSMPDLIHPVSVLLVGYFSTVAVLSLGMTVVARYAKNHDVLPILLHAIAFLASFFAFLTRSFHFLMIVQALVIVFALVFLFTRKSKVYTQNRITFLLLCIFWIVSIFAFSKHLFPPIIKLILYVLSTAIFLSIFIRVHKRLVHVKKKGKT